MLEVASLTLSYPEAPAPVFSNLGFSLQRGEMLYLTGANGSGKTSLLNCLSGVIPQRLEADLTGSIRLDGNDLMPVPLNERFRYLAYQMSDPEHQLFFPTLNQELSFALENQGLEPELIRKRITAAAQRFGLAEGANKAPHILSLGQKKLLLTAVCAALDPDLILLDEPCSGLSASAQGRLRQWLRETQDAGRIVIAADHNPILRSLSSQCLELGKR